MTTSSLNKSNQFRPPFNFVVQNLYNLWCFLHLYILGAVYAFIELQRKFQWPWPVRRLNVQSDLPSDLSQVVALVTGGSRGIGLETCRTLLSKGAQLIICSSRTGSALEQLELDLKNEFSLLKGSFQVWHLDLSSLDSVAQLVDRIEKSKVKLSLLINNAGIMFCPRKLTKDGLESQLATNFVGHALLTLRLLPLLSSNQLVLDGHRFQSRIVNVSSSTHFSRNLNLNDLNGDRLYSPFHAYAQSKLAQIMFGYRLVRKEICDQSLKVGIHAVHPGVVYTDLYQYVGWVNWMPWLAKQIFRTAKEGSETVLFAAVSTELGNKSGTYLEDSTVYLSSKFSYRQVYQDQLFDQTYEMINKFL